MTLAHALVPKPLKGLYTAGKKRKQEVRTPQNLLDVFADLLGGQIPLDPCATRSSAHHFARVNWSRGGTGRPWELPAYFNPPWLNLSEWLLHGRLEAARTGLPTIVLGPWRSNRNQFCSLVHGMEAVFLKAIAFRGHQNTHPAPCFVAAWHLKLPKLPGELGRGVITSTA